MPAGLSYSFHISHQRHCSNSEICSIFLLAELLIANKYGNMFSYFFLSKRDILDTSVTHLRLSFFPKKSTLLERTGP